MSEVAGSIQSWLRQARPVSIVRVIKTAGFSSRERAAMAAFAPGEPTVGSIFSGALDGPLRARLDAEPQLRTVLEISLSNDDAMTAGLACGGSARLLVQPASDIDEAGWAALAKSDPACLVTELHPVSRDVDTDGATRADDAPGAADVVVGDSVVFSAADIDEAEGRFGPGVRRVFGRGTSQTALLEVESGTTVVTSLWPVPSLVVVGGGQIADALAASAALLGWTPVVVDSGATALEAISGLTHADAVVVLSHDREVDGPALAAALSLSPGYIGGLGSAHTQDERAEWLVEHGVSPDAIAGIYGPAGLDIGAFSPAEIAASITAEIVAVRSGAGGGSLRGRTGPIRAN